MIRGWLPWLTFVGALGLLLMGLLINDPRPPKHNYNLQPIFYPEPEARPGYTLSKVRIGERDVAAYVLSKEGSDAKPRPAVILSHGGGMTDLLEFARPQYKGEFFIPLFDHVPYRLADAGFLVVAIDNWWAGERYEPKHAEMVQAKPLRSIFRGYVQTRIDVSSVIDVLVTREDVDPDRIGVAGWSGGGIISLMSIALDERVATIVAWKGAPDFMTMFSARGQAMLVSDELINDETFIEELKQGDAIHHYKNIPPRPLALIGNREDPAMPRELAERFVELLKPSYRDHLEHLRLSLYETTRPTHDLDREPLVEGCEWLIDVLSAED